MMKKYFYIMALLTLTACETDSRNNVPETITNTGFDVLSTQPRSEEQDSFCADFKLTQNQAAAFLIAVKKLMPPPCTTTTIG